jgi:hypothetical protein
VSDVKLFRITSGIATEMPGSSVVVEKHLQDLIERNLEPFLGIRFLASEFTTDKSHAGRIDTLGLDENDSPVIVEYKRTLNQNVINQGLFYLNWLMSHRADFQLLAMKKLGADIGERIDWSSPRLLCITGDFTKYDEHAIEQIDRSICLIRYRQYGPDFLILEQLNSTVNETATGGGRKVTGLLPTRSPRHLPKFVSDTNGCTRRFWG